LEGKNGSDLREKMKFEELLMVTSGNRGTMLLSLAEMSDLYFVSERSVIFRFYSLNLSIRLDI